MSLKDSPSPPPATDPVALARAQGGANLQSTIATNVMGHPTEVTPYGTRDWTQTGTYQIPAAEGNPAVDVPTWQSSIAFTPEGQSLFDTQQQISGQLGDIATSGLGRVGETFASPFDTASLPELPELPEATEEGRQAVEDAIFSRLEPRLAKDRETLRAQAINAGFRPGSEGYARSQTQADQAANDARMQAVLAGGAEQSRLFGLGAQRYGLGRQGRAQALQELAWLRNLPLTELNALRTGAQPSLPQFQPYSSANMQPANVIGATQLGYQQGLDAYNAQIGQQNAMTTGLFGLGAAGIMY